MVILVITRFCYLNIFKCVGFLGNHTKFWKQNIKLFFYANCVWIWFKCIQTNKKKNGCTYISIITWLSKTVCSSKVILVSLFVTLNSCGLICFPFVNECVTVEDNDYLLPTPMLLSESKFCRDCLEFWFVSSDLAFVQPKTVLWQLCHIFGISIYGKIYGMNIAPMAFVDLKNPLTLRP